MAGKTREIKGRMRAVGNIQRITKTMQMIATARYQALQRRATQAQAYRQKLAEVMGELAGSVSGSGDVKHPLLSTPDRASGRELVLVLTSNRGLAGAYNSNVLREAARYIRGKGIANVDIEAVGKKGVGFLKFNAIPMARHHSQIADTPQYVEVEKLAQRYMDEFAAGKYDTVKVVYTRFLSASRQKAEVMTLLPMEPPAAAQAVAEAPVGRAKPQAANYEFSPSAEELLAELVPMTVKTRLFGAFNEAVVSEQIMRMVAMKAATDAAGKMKKELGRRYNRARQAAITTELTEIIGGAAALE